MRATLLLPMLAADPLSGKRLIRKNGLPFSAVFDAPYFEAALANCTAALGNATDATTDAPFARCSRVAASLPLPPRSVQLALRSWSDAQRLAYHDRRVRWVSPELINQSWRHSHGLLTCVYRAIRPSEAVGSLITHLESEARARVGVRYVAIHLPIERDWWWESNFCKPRANDYPIPYARRCFTPAEVARRTAKVREWLNASGALLLYAHDKVGAVRHPYAGSPGPAVCAEDFGGTAFVQKLALPGHLNYTLRNAAEQWLAARAPVAFFGNSHSTFSQGVALMRAPGADAPGAGQRWDASIDSSQDPRASSSSSSSSSSSPSSSHSSSSPRSFAYDCVASRLASRMSAAGPGGGRLSGRPPPIVSMAHPGFWHLAPLPDAQAWCREDEWGELARAERWWRRGEPPL